MPFGEPVVPLVYKQEEKVLAVHGLSGAVAVGAVHQLVVPVIAPFDHGDVVTAALHHDDVFDRGSVGACLVGGRLQREDLTSAVTAVGGDQHLRLCVVDAVGQRL